MNIQDKINSVYANVQNLQVQPTEHNVMLLADVLLKLKEVFGEVAMMQKQIEELTAAKAQEEAPEDVPAEENGTDEEEIPEGGEEE